MRVIYHQAALGEYPEVAFMAGGWWSDRCHGKNGGKMIPLFLVWVKQGALSYPFWGSQTVQISGNVFRGFPLYVTMHCFGL